MDATDGMSAWVAIGGMVPSRRTGGIYELPLMEYIGVAADSHIELPPMTKVIVDARNLKEMCVATDGMCQVVARWCR